MDPYPRPDGVKVFTDPKTGNGIAIVENDNGMQIIKVGAGNDIVTIKDSDGVVKSIAEVVRPTAAEPTKTQMPVETQKPLPTVKPQPSATLKPTEVRAQVPTSPYETEFKGAPPGAKELIEKYQIKIPVGVIVEDWGDRLTIRSFGGRINDTGSATVLIAKKLEMFWWDGSEKSGSNYYYPNYTQIARNGMSEQDTINLAQSLGLKVVGYNYQIQKETGKMGLTGIYISK